MSKHGRTPTERAVPLAQCASIGYGPTPTSTEGARTSQARVLRLLLRESVRWRDRVCAHANSVCSLETAAGMSEHGHAPMERNVKLAQWAFMGYGTTPTTAAGRAHVASACAAPPPEGERAVLRSRVRTHELRLLIGGRGWHVGAQPCTDGEGRPAGTVSFHRVQTSSNQRGGARARRNRAYCASS